ncbi:MAG: acyl-CoA thioesterase [Tissierellia bacterium]|jgi:uncharacterized protein (TIGR00369 family)|nr:acyl-CoA thioesterase [Tissierellia bacterium]
MILNKNISFSSAVATMLMQPMNANSQGSVHGGDLVKIMDNIAGIAARKHSRGMVVTARIDELVFHKPVFVGDIITCIGQVAYVGSSSMQVMVKVLVDHVDKDSEPEIAISSFFTMVHLKDGKPAPVEKIVAVTDEEKDLYKLGEQIYLEIKSKYK